MAKRKEWRGWAVLNGGRLKWVDVEDDARKATIDGLNRPSGDRAVEVIVTLAKPPRKRSKRNARHT